MSARVGCDLSSFTRGSTEEAKAIVRGDARSDRRG